jgi:hypothetical protein
MSILAQPFVGFSRVRDRRLRLGTRAHNLGDFGRYSAVAACEFGPGFTGQPRFRAMAAGFFLCLLRRIHGVERLTRLLSGTVVGEVS